ncbi:hypothetical protein ABZS88_22255 [Streptomyces sp. NPDC005480]|jgi:hypothetical protein|uniref:hypothetical protein n=1 Tax=Streptomyces sp. NPDC005480 TaxID=3154880 RepID=UPI0033A58B26
MPSSSEQSEPTESTDTAEASTEESEAHDEAAGTKDTEGAKEAKPSDESKNADEAANGKGVDRRGIAVCGVLVTACAGLVLYGVLDTDEKPERHVPTASVTYEVSGEGTADLTWQARSESGKAVAARGVTLPWKKTVRVPLGKPPIVTITLGEKGGRASCRLAVRGKHVQTATAYGKFGRATCQGELPAPEVSESPASAQGEQ